MSAPDVTTVDGEAPGRPAQAGRRRLKPRSYRLSRYAVLAVFLVVTWNFLPTLLTTRSSQYLAGVWIVYAIVGIGFYWMFSLGGRFAFSQTAMMALGAYVSAKVDFSLEQPNFLLTAGLGMLACVALALFVGLVLRRTHQFYFAIGTLALTQICFEVFRRSESFTGPNGSVIGVAPIEILGTRYLTDEDLFTVFLAFLGIVLLLGLLLEQSPLYRRAVAARDNLPVAQSSGIRTTSIHVTLFCAGSALGGLAGAMLGHSSGVVSPDSFGFNLSIGIFLMLFLGGSGSIWGPVVGSAVYVALPQYLSGIEQYSQVVYGLLLLVVVIALPNGIVGVLDGARIWMVSKVMAVRGGGRGGKTA